MNEEKNYGLVLTNPPIDGNRFGGVSSVPNLVPAVPGGNWTPWLPAAEIQRNSVGDTYACVTFSALNAIEIMFRRMGIDKNFSDRFTAKQDGTIPGVGNGIYAVAQCIEANGLLEPESAWPYSPTMTVSEYYADLSAALIAQAQQIKLWYGFDHEFVPTDAATIAAALEFAPVQVCISAYGPTVNGIIQRTTARVNHAIVVFNAVAGQYFEAFDSEQDKPIKLAWDTIFGGALKYEITKAVAPQPNMPAFNFQEGFLYELVEGQGGFLLYAAGKLRNDDLAKLLALQIVRNGGDNHAKVGTLLLRDLEGVQLFNLKGEPVNL